METLEPEAGLSPQPLGVAFALGRACDVVVLCGFGVEGFVAFVVVAGELAAGAGAGASAAGATSAAGVSVFSAVAAGLSVFAQEVANSAKIRKPEIKRVRCKFFIVVCYPSKSMGKRIVGLSEKIIPSPPKLL